MQAKIKKKKISDSQSCINNPRKPFSEKKYSIAHLLARNRLQSYKKKLKCTSLSKKPTMGKSGIATEIHFN